jgi:hypothetical protein
MSEEVVLDIDTDMRRRPPGRIEEDQVSESEMVLRYRSTREKLFAGRPRQLLPRSRTIHGCCKARTVDAVPRHSSIPVGGPEERDNVKQHSIAIEGRRQCFGFRRPRPEPVGGPPQVYSTVVLAPELLPDPLRKPGLIIGGGPEARYGRAATRDYQRQPEQYNRNSPASAGEAGGKSSARSVSRGRHATACCAMHAAAAGSPSP